MTGSKVLAENVNEVNHLLRKVSGFGLVLFYSLCFLLKYFTMMEMVTYPELYLATGISFALYFVIVGLYSVHKIRPFFHYLFPLQMYLTIGIGYMLFHATIPSFFIWLVPVIYGGLYAHRGSMIMIGCLVLVTAPLETYLVGNPSLNDLATVTLILLIITLRLISMVNRSRKLIQKTEQEVERSAQLQQENQRLLAEVAVTTAEMGEVIQQLNHMTQGTRSAMMQIAHGGEHIIVSSQASQQILVNNQQFVMEQVKKSDHISSTTKQAVIHTQNAKEEATESERVVSQMSSIIHTIDQVSHHATERAMVLAERTKEIYAISESITSIAKNVTVVAINASIEAARAGAAGRTFQVVAEQVHQLALQASDAAKAIGLLSEHVQEDLTGINDSMFQSSVVVKSGVEISEQATQKLNHIKQAVDEIHILLKEIAGDAELQLLDAAKIDTGMRNLRDKAEENLTHIETAAASTEETAAIMDEFMIIVSRLQDRSQNLQRLIQEIGH